MLRTYRVSFFKRLADSTGHAVDAWQGSVELSAPSKAEAIAIARRSFAEAEDVCRWSLRADYETVELLPPHGKPPGRHAWHGRFMTHHSAA